MSKKKPKPAPVKPRVEPARLLAPNGGYVQDPRYALGATARHTTEAKDPAFYDTENEVPPEPEAVDKETQKWITDEAKGRDEARKGQIPLHEELRAIEANLRPQQRAELRRRIEGFKRSAHEKAA